YGDGQLTLQMVDSIGVTDLAGNALSNLPFTGETYTIVRPKVHVASVQINDGSAQRSMVTSLKVSFDQPPLIGYNPIGVFQLKRQSDDAVVGISTDVNGNDITLSFIDGPVEYGSLADGRYTLTIFGSKIANFDGNYDGISGDDFVLVGDPATNHLYRLFGD